MKHCLALALTALLLTGCSPAATAPAESTPAFSPIPSEEPLSPPPPEETDAGSSLPEPDPIAEMLASMTNEEKVGQLFFVRCPAKDGATLAAQYHLGGYILFGRDFKDSIGNWLTEEQLTRTIQNYQGAASIPLLIGVDEEGGTVVRASRNPNLFPEKFKSPQQLFKLQCGEEDIFSKDALEKSSGLLRLGINVNLAPVCDVSTDPNSFIYDRTLGQNAAATAQYVTSVVTAMRTSGIGSVLKHFPGYGTNQDTHTGSALDTRPLETFQTEDFLPFQAGIEAGGGTAAVLVSHNIIQQVDPDRPASLSPAVYRLLREELDFDGPALTDDLDMDAATLAAGKESPAVLALTAGCDLVVTGSFQKEIPRVLAALEDGTLSQERVDEAAARVLHWKYDLGLIA